MALKEKISSLTGIPKEEIPGSYQIIGDILLVKFSKEKSQKDKKMIAEAALKTIRSVKSVFESCGIDGEFRIPKVIFLAGENRTRTVHIENGIKYSVDISKVMFSKGNLFERQRLIGKIRKGEIIVDMFAGIGYFSLGIAKSPKACKVIAIEKNPESFRILRENMKLNSASKLITVPGDCREISRQYEFQHIADRVIMGYFPGTCEFLPSAFMFLKDRGIIHYHDIYQDEELWEKPIGIIKSAADKSGFMIKSVEKKKVKSFSPRKWHIVMDISTEKKLAW